MSTLIVPFLSLTLGCQIIHLPPLPLQWPYSTPPRSSFTWCKATHSRCSPCRQSTVHLLDRMTLLKVKTSRATSLLVVSHQSLDKIQTPSCDPIFLTDWLLLNFVVLSSQLHHTPRHFLCLSHTYFFSFVSTVFLLHPSLPCLSKKKKNQDIENNLGNSTQDF